MNRINKILIANRGEIALRIMRSAREMQLLTVAVYSEADKMAPHVYYADEAICIGPAEASQSYLSISKIIAACRQTGADAVHPGYGFLSENAAFASALAEAGILFIGPSAASIATMGNKLRSKQAAQSMGVPLVPGGSALIHDLHEAQKEALNIGYPIMIKASAGGGGKGMRIVYQPADLEEQLLRARSEALNAFGEDSVFMEKFITNPKHIEVQILGDQHGNILHLFERECSVQRRNQKVLEEAPSPVISPTQRKLLGDAAINVARSCDYYSAGTVEFILDDQGQFYFLEMNTRLQVEHPVTEMITGLDLVKEQIRIAQGQSLPYKQEDLTIHGHSIEVRIYAEDPKNEFLPDTGQLTCYKPPLGPGIRVDDGYEALMSIPIYYDPMIAKLIVHGQNRKEAIDRMLRALQEFRIEGVTTSIPFCQWVLQHHAFLNGSFTTRFIEQYFNASELDQSIPEEILNIGVLVAKNWFQSPSGHEKILPQKNSSSRWKNRLRNN